MTGRKPALFVEIDGFEPTTLCLQSRCSSQLSYTPICRFFERLLRCPPSSVGHYHQVTPSLFSRPPCIHLKITSKVIGNLFGDCCIAAKKTFKELVGAEGVEPPTLCL